MDDMNNKNSKENNEIDELNVINEAITIDKTKEKNIKNKKKICIIIIAILLILAITAGIVYANRRKIFPRYNSKYKLELMSAYGDNEPYHPKILSFKEKWNGYLYWMSYTPYPKSDSSKENPHVKVSNDMINWVEVEGFKNPIDEMVQNQNKKMYNSDSHLVYNPDLNRLECYWRYVDDTKDEVIIYRCYTTDGIHWSKKEVSIMSQKRSKLDFVSPAILYENGIYKMWYVNQKNIIKYRESKDGKIWEKESTIELEYPTKLNSWHLDVIRTEEKYEMIIVAFPNWSKRGFMNLYYSSSKDNKTWTTATKIMKPTIGTKNWDDRGIYRSSFLKIDGIYYVFYSASNTENEKGIGIMYGRDITHLKRVNIDFKKDKKAVEKFKGLIENEKKL